MVIFPENFDYGHALCGKQLFEFERDSNLRIMSNNVWVNDKNLDNWAEMGEDCSAEHRAKGIAACYMAFMPDIINVQEMTVVMLPYVIDNFKKCGYEYSATENIHSLNILYNTKTINLVDHGYHIFTYGSNSDGKGYVWAVFEHKATGKRFASLSTHFWWMGESMRAGSDAWREAQALETADRCREIAEQYNCPVFLGGDFNCRTSSQAIKNILSKGMLNCFGAALENDDFGSHHPCGREGFEKGNIGKNEDAIDHLFCYNLGDSVLNAFRRTEPEFFIKLSDHYPLYSDVKL